MIICGKLRQLRSGTVVIVVIAIDTDTVIVIVIVVVLIIMVAYGYVYFCKMTYSANLIKQNGYASVW